MRREPLMTVQNIADELQVSVFTVRRWIRDGKMRPDLGYQGLGYRISREELERFKRDRTSLISAVGAAPAT